MKSFLLIVIILCQQCRVTSAGFDTNVKKFINKAVSKLKEFANVVAKMFKTMAYKIKSFFIPSPSKPRKLSEKQQSNVFMADYLDTLQNISTRKLRSEPLLVVSVSQLATIHGVKVESHMVLTKDGYFITLHRFKTNESKKKSNNNTVLLHHGLLGSTADWILLGSQKSLPYLLLKEGYDVWLTNARGNYYSRSHISEQLDSSFWDFSWYEMGKYDLPAVVDYIIDATPSQHKISFIGHSMGATVFLTMLSLFPDYNSYFRIGIFLAPLVFMIHTEGPLRTLSTVANNPPNNILKLLGTGEFIPTRIIPKWVANTYCQGPEAFCMNPLLFLTGRMSKNNSWDISLIKSIFHHLPAGGSTKTILHYAKMVKSGRFQVYNKDTEELSLGNVNVPIVLFSSSDDKIATVPDVLKLFLNLTCPIDHYLLRDKGITHMDFVWNPKADVLIFAKVLEYLRQDVNCSMSKLNELY